MTGEPILFAIGTPNALPRAIVEGNPAFVRAQLRTGEVAARILSSSTAPAPLPATSEI